MYESTYGLRHYKHYSRYFTNNVSRFLLMSNFFIGKYCGLTAKVRVILHATMVLCLSINSPKSTFAVTTLNTLQESEQITQPCAASPCGKEFPHHKRTAPHYQPLPRQISSMGCWEETGEHFRIDPSLLKAIAWKESRGRPNAIGQKLKDGNVALGLMQINTIHLKNLKQFGINRDKLFDACINQKVGAWVLADCISKFGSTWKAVGCYYTGPNSNNITAQIAYVSDVQRFYAGYKNQEQQRRDTHQKEVD